MGRLRLRENLPLRDVLQQPANQGEEENPFSRVYGKHPPRSIYSIKSSWRDIQEKKTYDPMVTIAYERAKESRLLFLDEFQVTDVADATMLKRLFEKMIGNGLVLLATSNREP